MRFCYRPFDLRWLYWEPETKLLDEKRADYFPHIAEGNLWLAATQQNRKDVDPPVVSQRPSSRHVVERGANLFPLRLNLGGQGKQHENLSAAAQRYLDELSGSGCGAGELFHHAVAILHAPAYRADNASALRQNWPRIPLPASAPALKLSADLGRQVVALLDPETAVEGVTAGTVRPELSLIGVASRMDGRPLDPHSGDLDVTAGWGHAGKGGVTMPGAGRVIARDFSPAELDSIGRGALGLGFGSDEASRLLGETTCDIYLNAVGYFRNVPPRVWEYRLGGYQVVKKWLSYRERKRLGRALTPEEARYVRDTARRIAALLLLGPALDGNYAAARAALAAFAPARPRPAN